MIMFETDMYGMCRVCLNDSRFYSRIYEELLREDYLYVVLNDVCQLDVKMGDGLPEFVCCECYKKLSELESFKRLSHEGSATLLRMKNDLENVYIKVEEDPFGDVTVEEDVAFPLEVNIKVEEDPNADETVEVDGGFTEEVSDKMVGDTLKHASIEEQLEYPAQVQVKVEEIIIEDDYVEDDNGVQWTGEDDEFTYGVTSREFYLGYPTQVSSFPVCLNTAGTVSFEAVKHKEAIGIKIPKRARRNKDTISTILSKEASAANNADEDSDNLVMNLEMTNPTYEMIPSKGRGTNEIGHHVRIHTLKCPTCDMTFECNTHLHRHILHCGPRIHERNIVNNYGKPYICSECGKSYTKNSSLVKHIQTHKREKFSCKVCDKSFSLMSDLFKHLKLHGDYKPFPCTICGMSFKYEDSLQQHRRTHYDELPFHCDICGKGFHTKSYLKQHQLTHSNERPTFSCSICDKSFTTKPARKQHVDTKHYGLKPFKCSICPKAFTTKWILKCHVQSHSKLKPFPCPKCGKYIKYLHNLKGHLALFCKGM